MEHQRGEYEFICVSFIDRNDARTLPLLATKKNEKKRKVGKRVWRVGRSRASAFAGKSWKLSGIR